MKAFTKLKKKSAYLKGGARGFHSDASTGIGAING